MDAALDTAILTCTGSEVNDIALRMAEGVTGKRGVIATDATYHGNTALVSQLGKANTQTVGFGLEQYFRFVDTPDSGRRPDPDGKLFAQSVADLITAPDCVVIKAAPSHACKHALPGNGQRRLQHQKQAA